jgi:large subunit ribosomal protein L5
MKHNLELNNKKMVKDKIKKLDTNEVRQFLEKIVVNAGVGKMGQNPNFQEKGLVEVARSFALITGQKPQYRSAKKSIAGFKLREGAIVGLRVTLRKKKMIDFLARLINIVLPRVRDFNGIDPRNVDKGGALNIGFKEQYVFPEINPEESNLNFSLGVNLVPKVKDRNHAIENYHKLGVPLKDKKPKTKNQK